LEAPDPCERAEFDVDTSERGVVPDSVCAYDLARRAIAVAAHMGPTLYGQAFHFDLQAEAAMALANASRCRSRYLEARKMLDLASSC